MLRTVMTVFVSLAFLLCGTARTEETAPSIKINAQPGTLKLSSSPKECIITFRGNRYQKQKSVMTFTDVPPGDYVIGFISGGKTVEKRATVRSGEVTILFGNIKAEKKIVQATEVTAVTPGTSSLPKITDAKLNRALPQAVRNIEDANDIFKLAEIYRKAMNPFEKEKRYRQAERLYQKIIERWPESDKVEMAHYRLGQIYESIWIQNYNQAIAQYKRVIERNFDTELDARWQIARLYEKALGDKKVALEWYTLSAKYSRDDKVRKRALKRVEALKALGY